MVNEESTGEQSVDEEFIVEREADEEGAAAFAKEDAEADDVDDDTGDTEAEESADDETDDQDAEDTADDETDDQEAEESADDTVADDEEGRPGVEHINNPPFIGD